jgi:hypothetical protein
MDFANIGQFDDSNRLKALSVTTLGVCHLKNQNLQHTNFFLLNFTSSVIHECKAVYLFLRFERKRLEKTLQQIILCHQEICLIGSEVSERKLISN